jgi:hypothetical protein
VRVEFADVLGVKKSNGPGGVPVVADARRLPNTNGSDAFAGDFVTYAVLISRTSPADPFKYEADLDTPPVPS